MRLRGLVIAFFVVTFRFEEAKDVRDYPYVVSIHRNTPTRNFICAGSLITDTWVLTTSNCLPDYAYKIRYGNMFEANTSDQTYSKIEKRVRFPNKRVVLDKYAINNQLPPPKTNDIALARVERVPHIQPGHISSIDYASLVGHKAIYFELVRNVKHIKTGQESYGKLVRTIYNNNKKRDNETFGGSEKSFKTMEVKEGVITKCPRVSHPGPSMCLAGECVINEDMENPWRWSIWPDHGTPLVLDKKIIGMTSDYLEHYTYYTPVSPFLDWIVEQTQRGDKD